MDEIRESYQQARAIIDGIELFKIGKEKIESGRFSDSIKIIFSIILFVYQNEFSGDNMNSRIARKMIGITLEKFPEILRFFSEQIAETMGRNLIDRKFKKFMDVTQKTLEDRIEQVKKENAHEFMKNLFSYIVGISQDMGKIESEIMQFSVAKKDEEVEDESEIQVGQSVCAEYLTVEKLSNNVWKTRKGKYFYAIRFTPYQEMIQPKEKETSKVYSGRVDRILKSPEKLRECSVRWKKRNQVPNLANQILPVIVEYDSKTKSICEITLFYEKTLNDLEGVNKNKMFISLYNFVRKLHKSGKVFYNLCPDKLVYEITEDDNYSIKLTDLYQMTDVDEECIDIQWTGYQSLAMLESSRATFYDDLESLFYITNYLIDEHFPKFESLETEKTEKINLGFCNEKIKNAIELFRIDKENNETEYQTIQDYIDNFYGDDMDNYIRELAELFLDINIEEVYGTKIQNELYRLIFNNKIAQVSKNKLQIENFPLESLKETFELMYGVGYKTTNI